MMDKFETLNKGEENVEKLKPTGIIAGSPGIGKTTLIDNLPKDISVEDMEPTPYTQYEDWPNNYIEDVVKKAVDTDLLLITTNPVVVQALVERGYKVSVVSPDEALTEEYRQRYIDRGNKPEVVERIIEKAHKSNEETRSDFEGCDVMFLQSGQYLSDVIDLD